MGMILPPKGHLAVLLLVPAQCHFRLFIFREVARPMKVLRSGEIDSPSLMEMLQGHIAEECAGWDMLMRPSLENVV